MSSPQWKKPLKITNFKGSWKFRHKKSSLGPNSTKYKTLRPSDSSPIISKGLQNNTLNSLITQAGYSKSTISYSVPKTEPVEGYYLPRQREKDRGKKTLVLDLDETLVHSSFKPVLGADIVLSIQIENIQSNVYVLVRPGTYEFLE